MTHASRGEDADLRLRRAQEYGSGGQDPQGMVYDRHSGGYLIGQTAAQLRR